MPKYATDIRILALDPSPRAPCAVAWADGRIAFALASPWIDLFRAVASLDITYDLICTIAVTAPIRERNVAHHRTYELLRVVERRCPRACSVLTAWADVAEAWDLHSEASQRRIAAALFRRYGPREELGANLALWRCFCVAAYWDTKASIAVAGEAAVLGAR